ncbi:MAG: phytanoyl-CoA dioxygenase family protein [Kofleriaceae bacterium]|nr:MAG: phytanoyl-CoA dioxygenase family protein [Kofleriaceae bacterium]MBZ0233457.1 phytanoyl-CoA dioxygenase family protein [Kofleriaceae bacterium]
MLTAAQLDRFRADGFLLLPGFVAAAACDELRARAEELMAAFEPGARRTVFTTSEQARKTDDYFLDSGEDIRFFFEEADPTIINKLGHALHDLDPVFARFSRTPAIASVVEALGIADPRVLQSMYILKAPRVGGEVRCHQDATYLHTDPPEAMIGLWFALEDARTDNACLWAIPGGHRDGLRAKFVRDGRATRLDVLDPRPWDDARLVPLEARQGDLILLDGLVPHLSYTNRSPRSRHAYTLHVISGAAPYPATNWLQRTTPPRGF